jgi:flavin reductase (DIM6/NTAB) family NADH-FMN oxidoreductase RutF
MLIDVSQADPMTVYHMIVGVVTPRPIAWVTTVDREGRVNLAPFSFYNAFGANPPIVVFSPLLRPDGTKKDSLLNVEATGEFVVNGSVASLVQQVNLTSAQLPYGESEATLAGLELTPSVKVKPPRVAESPTHLECVVRQIVAVGTGPSSANLVIGEIVAMHVADAVLDERGRIDPRKLRAVGRLGGDYWCNVDEAFEIKRP